MDAHQELRKKLLAMVAQLLRQGSPELVVDTFDRLQEEGFSDEESHMLIAQCIGIEFLDGATDPEDFDAVRFERNLNKLPRPPYEDDSDSTYGTGGEEGFFVDGEFDDF